ncbi:methyl-accepting chemotaxis protein [Bosea sp. BK604]|uniref:methyl-accepting chemotaxis protein n=1 Tax=Bosea sp. BK604 TaxID=2512180 RepID=UPI0010E24D44|nr:methyl-accepting chemotaxis protein [Bosea sp. BK604]TCR69969.1 methyl-accepting chemotaxis protein [Bosea sp. BK604]
MFKKSLVLRVVWPLVLGIGTLIAAVIFLLPPAFDQMILEEATRQNLAKAQQTLALRSFYLETVVNKVTEHGTMKVSPNYRNEAASVPFQASFISDYLGLISDGDTKAAFVSPYPFPYRAERKLDGFQQAAWDALQAKPDEPFVRRETIGGKDFVRMAVGDRLKQSCLGCHNDPALSPKVGWREGDVRGLLEISRSVDAILATSHATSRTLVLLFALGGCAVAALLIWAMLHSTLRPLRKLTDAIRKMAAGGERSSIPCTERKDEIGMIAGALANLSDSREAERVLAHALDENRSAHQNELAAMAASFESDVHSAVTHAAIIAEALRQTAGELSTLATSAELMARGGATNVDKLRDCVTVSSVTSSNLLSSIIGTRRAVGAIAQSAQVVAGEAASTDAIAAQLARAADEIESTVGMIGGIAAHTNLLALNATIEAARAGEAGRGFSVVASEVKALSVSTSAATAEIAKRAQAMRIGVASVLGAMATITDAVSSMDEASTALGSSVEADAAKASDGSSLTEQAKRTTTDLTATLDAMLSNAVEVSGRAGQVAASAQDMAARLGMLTESAEQFAMQWRRDTQARRA